MPRPTPGPRRGARRAGGWMLLETLVGLAILGVALLLTAFVLAHERSVVDRAAAQRQALEVSEAVLELVRAGSLPVADRQWDPESLPLGLALGPRRMTVWLDVEPEAVPRLWRVEVRTRYVAARQVQTTALAGLVWRPHDAWP